jgi:predicted HD superfamily hydrolase involved in NAD metabolism
MDYTEIIKILERDYLSKLSISRAEHSRRTAEMARDLAIQYGEKSEKAYLAGLAHDIAKELPEREILDWAERYKPEQIYPEERQLPLLLHGRAAAAILMEELKIEDEEVLDSVTWHISGDLKMREMDKIIYCADYLEKGRSFLSQKFREKARAGSLDTCVKIVLTSILEYRKEKGHGPSQRECDILNNWKEENHNA